MAGMVSQCFIVCFCEVTHNCRKKQITKWNLQKRVEKYQEYEHRCDKSYYEQNQRTHPAFFSTIIRQLLAQNIFRSEPSHVNAHGY